jgi:hypothetical protein
MDKISELVIGNKYTRHDLDYFFGTDNRFKPPSLEGWFSIKPIKSTVVLLDLSNEDKKEEHGFNNYFEQDFFHQDSQIDRTEDSPTIQEVINEQFTVYLFCRESKKIKGKTQPFLYCGRLKYLEHSQKNTPRPIVHLIYQCEDYQDETDNEDLIRLYNWSPNKIGKRKDNNSDYSKTVSERRKKKYTKPKKTSELRFVNQRVGQSYFRNQLLDRWDYKCAVTGYDNYKICIASHIVPWKISEEDRLEIDNGILLSPDLDALFDKKLISFKDNGKIIMSKKILKNISMLGINEEMSLSKVTEGMKKYLSWHREKFYEKEDSNE